MAVLRPVKMKRILWSVPLLTRNNFLFGHVINLLFTKCSVNMTGYWAGSFPRFNGPSSRSRFIKTQIKKNSAEFEPY